MLFRSELVKLIQAKIKTAQDRQKSYADLKRRPVEFEVGDKVFLRVSPSKGVMRFGIKGKLSPKYIGLYDIVGRVGNVAYRLELPTELERVHNVFHVSQLRKYISDPSHVIERESVTLNDTLAYVEEPEKILDTKVRTTRNKEIRMVKVQWKNHGREEATWELEGEMRKSYPSLFEDMDVDSSVPRA